MFSEANIELFRAVAIIAGLAVAGIGYTKGQNKIKIANSNKLLVLFKKNIDESDIDEWSSVFKSSNDAEIGHFIHSKTQQIPLGTLLGEAPKDKGATSRIAGQIDIMCDEILKGKFDMKTVYFEIGQLMNVIYEWLKDEPIFEERFPHYKKLMTVRKLSELECKSIA